MTWVAVVVTFSLIILVHELGHFLVARWVGVKVERFSLGFGPRLLRWRGRDTEYALSLFPIGGYVKMAGEEIEEGAPKRPWEYRARSVAERMGIVAAGPFVNYAVGFALFALIFFVGAPILTTRVGKILEGYPAAASELKVGDRVLSVNDRPVEIWEEMTRTIQSQTGAVLLKVDREGTVLTVTVQPSVREVTNLLGARVRVGMIGITPSEEFQVKRYPLPQALVKAGERVWMLTSVTLQALWRMATGGLSIKDSVTGPIGIFVITSSVAEQGLISLLHLVAILSTSLGLFNLLPLPVLDGGHLAFLLAERLKGTPVSPRTQEMMTRVGLGLLVLLLLVVTVNDLARFRVVDWILPWLGGGQP